MRGYFNRFWLQKRGAAAAEYEDASWVGPNGNDEGDFDQQRMRFVIADGASESLLAGHWARHLVTIFGETEADICTNDGFVAAYTEAVDSWDAELARYKQQREERNAPIQWYEEPGLAKGAYSTILAMELCSDEGRGLQWAASAIGDSCIFQVRDDELYRSFPMTSADDFGNQPALLNSRGTSAETLNRHIAVQTADWEPNDSFYLVTDAMAAWFLRMNAAGQRPWVPLRDLDTDGAREFADLADSLRTIGEIRDDDTTLIRVDMWQPW